MCRLVRRFVVGRCRTGLPYSAARGTLHIMNKGSKRPPRLMSVFQKYDPPLFFVTFGTFNRKPVLAYAELHSRFLEFAERSAERDTAIGKYVIMPDHIHFFIRPARDHRLGPTIGFLKRSLSGALKRSQVVAPHWQPGFFDHLIRSSKSYSEKWDYVVQNPVRAGLVDCSENWPYCGEVVSIRY